MPVDFHVWAATHTGYARAHNEDACLVGRRRLSGSVMGWHGVVDRDSPWVVVADGMGGHVAGEIASDVALTAMQAHLGKARTTEDVVEMLDAANYSVHEAMYGAIERRGMGTTVVGALLGRQHALIFNVGDSRAYGLSGQAITLLSTDHSVGASTGKRSPLLFQSLGGTMNRRPLMPGIRQVELADFPTLVLCTDGLTDLVDDEEIASIVSRGPGNPADELVSAALREGGRDNVSAIVVSAMPETV